MNTNKFDWGAALKVEVGDLTNAPSSGSGKASAPPITAGRYPAFLQSVKHGTFKSGSYGLTLTYVIESGPYKNRKKSDYLVLRKADGSDAGNGGRLKKTLMQLGLPIEKIGAFRAPRNEHDLGDLALTIGAPVTIVIKNEVEKGTTNPVYFNGQASTRINGVYARVTEEVAAA